MAVRHSTTLKHRYSLHKIILNDLGVKQIASVVGGSMGGMLVLEYAYFGPEYVKTIVPIATASRHSAWGISWGEAQRQSIYCDPKYLDGYYVADDPPTAGLGAARMSALLTYRSRDSFESRFGRNAPDPSKKQAIGDDQRPSTPSNEHWVLHNDGHRNAGLSRQPSTQAAMPSAVLQNGGPATVEDNSSKFMDPQFHGTTAFEAPSTTIIPKTQRATTYFSAQTYLRYQGEKFVKRFDSNCYIAITRKLDTHDVSRHRVPSDISNPVAAALSQIRQPALVLGIESDGLFTYAEQKEIAASIPDSRLRTIVSPEGHDAFLLQFQQVNSYILDFFREVLPDIMSQPVLYSDGAIGTNGDAVGTMAKSSTFGKAEVGDITAW